jgi:putative peptidoglycan lipid II flippase
MSRISRASLIIAVFFGLDKILGLVRVVLFNRAFGPADRDVFFVSNNIPDLLSALISGGALGIALIPVLTEHIQLKGRPDAWRLFSQIINLAFLVTATIALGIILLAEPLIQHDCPGI